MAEGTEWDNEKILDEHLRLRRIFPDVRLLWSGDWSTFDGRDYWVSVVPQTFGSSTGALQWCTANGFDRNHCIAKLVSTTHPVAGSTALN